MNGKEPDFISFSGKPILPTPRQGGSIFFIKINLFNRVIITPMKGGTGKSFVLLKRRSVYFYVSLSLSFCTDRTKR